MHHEIIWTPGISLDTMEKMIVLKAFDHYQKDKERTSQSLGIAIRTLEYKLKKYEEEDQTVRDAQEKRKEEANRQELRKRFGDRMPYPEGLNARPQVWSRPITNSQILPSQIPTPPTVPIQVTTLRRKSK